MSYYLEGESFAVKTYPERGKRGEREAVLASFAAGKTRVLVITPTRELAVQIHAMTGGLGRHTDVRVAMAVGGLSLQTQETSLRTRPDMVVATPGRMIDLIRNSNSISMDDLEILILDEADRLLDLGFQDEVEELVKLCPRGRQVCLQPGPV